MFDKKLQFKKNKLKLLIMLIFNIIERKAFVDLSIIKNLLIKNLFENVFADVKLILFFEIRDEKLETFDFFFNNRTFDIATFFF